MTRFQLIDRALKAKGWTFDVANEEFRDGTRPVGWRELVLLLPGMTMDELAKYVDHNDKARKAPA